MEIVLRGRECSGGGGTFFLSADFEANERFLAAPTNTLRGDPSCVVHLHADFCSMTRALKYHSNASKQNRNYNSNRQNRTVNPHNTLTVFVETGKNRTNIGLIGILRLGLYY